VTNPAFVPFEHVFPAAFAASVKDLVDGVALDVLLARLCDEVSAAVAPLTVRAHRRDEAGFEPPPGPVPSELLARRRVTGPDNTPWGELVVRGPAGAEIDRRALDALAGYAGWIVDRHHSRRRHLATIDRERQVIAGQLHDDSIQSMTAVSLHLQRLARSDTVDREAIERVLQLANDAIERLRHMMFALYPPSLAADGLVTSLEDYLEGFIAPAGLHTSVSGDPSRRSTAATEALAFRLARDAIHNSWQHAQASRIDVAVEADADGVRVAVHDDGIGFDTTAVHPASVGHGGIEYSRLLVAEAGGRYDLESTDGRGTTVTIDLPAL